MMAKILALFAIALSLVGGAAAGHFLKPVADNADESEAVPEQPKALDAVATLREAFVVPILRDGQVWSHVILSLGVASDNTGQEDILLREPVLRDGLTEALFLHGSLGGFDGNFTDPVSMQRLRLRLDDVLRERLDDETARVLISSVTRQSS
ncbi:MAG: hypothetical protein WBA02_02065 [Jannaschia helgolandensis]|jgi:flagellar protein FliL|uniref:Flagellar protein FliL n=1 Tax=Jannaschia helgolandensis TaxID=188906 RepID=A0A1H7H2C0_9RHOB|nr:hypothetical protein [Jannaschia helgolandensis]SEK44439.1 hypothetical protein SAMN04488526_0589 [Jannaschia helgolandensis]